MSGFFSKDDVIGLHKGITKGKPIGCASCGLYRQCLSPKMQAHGQGKLSILTWAEAPGEDEDKRGKQLVGKIGTYYRGCLGKYGIDLDRDTVKINSINCRPPDNRMPKPNEIQACKVRCYSVLHETRPKAVFLLGGVAIESYFGHRTDIGGGITMWRGWQIPDRENNCWVFPMFHPSYVLRNEKVNPAVETVFLNDLEHAIQHYQDPFPAWKPEEECIEILFSIDDVLERLDRVARQFHNPIAFDFETTGLRPIARGHHIVACSIATGFDHAFAFQLNDVNIERLLKRILVDPEIKKVAQNMKFEDMWSRAVLNCTPQAWYWDTMYGEHVLDNRRGTKNLEFQAAKTLGFFNFKGATDEYLASNEKNANGFNRIYDAPMRDVLKRCALDSLTEYRIATLQWKQFEGLK